MFQNKKFWKTASIIVATCLIMSFMPEIRILGIFIEAIGIDMFLVVIGGHFLFALRWARSKTVGPMLNFGHCIFEKMDPYYFVAKRKDVMECPQLIFHAVPYLVGTLFFLSCNGWLYA